MLVRPGLAHIFSQVQYELADASVAPAGAASEGMNVRQFASEAYPQVTRSGAWQDLLAQFGLRSDLPTGGLGAFAMAALKGDSEGMALGRLTAASQTLSPIFRRGGLPIGLLPLDEDIEIETGGGIVWVPPGTLAVLPLDSEWRIPLDKSVRLAAFLISDSLLRGRRPATLALPAPRRFAPDGLAAVLIKAVETAVAEMDGLSDAEWRALEKSFVDLVLTVIAEAEASEPSSPSLAALFNRAALTIERRLHDPNLSAARIARFEGISERYLQKLFEQNGETFSHYLRERRLQRARAALTAPGDLRTPVADVAYACGFGDAANFNRLFKERFGLPPGAFRACQAEKLLESAGAEQRGWPVRALANPKNQQRGLPTGAAPQRSEDAGRRGDLLPPPTRRHFSQRALGLFQPVLEAGPRDPFGRLRRGRNPDPTRFRRAGPDDPGRRGGGGCLSLDQGPEGRGSTGRGSARRFHLRPRRGRRFRGAYLHRADLCQRRRPRRRH